MSVALAWLLSACSSSDVCRDYVDATIAELRQADGSGCFQLSHVVLAARTPSVQSPRLYLQDPAGGDFSALMAKCAGDSQRACPASAVSATRDLLNGSLVTVRGYYHQGSRSGFEELYLDAVIDEGSFADVPAPVVLSASDVAKSARRPESWFQVVSVTIPEDDPWVMADLSPSELELGSECPRWAGFSMVPASRALPVPADCTNGQNPDGSSAAMGDEILIGRQFYDSFWASTDCACAVTQHQHLLSPYATLVGATRAVLMLSQSNGATFQILQPLAKRDFPVSGG
jgi:hypothetical protein